MKRLRGKVSLFTPAKRERVVHAVGNPFFCVLEKGILKEGVCRFGKTAVWLGWKEGLLYRYRI
jgi:hypothetical protein